jgi:putative Holliday junction resolvase
VTDAVPRPPGHATVLAFDFGARRVGVAVGNTITRAAQPLATIDEPAQAARFSAIAALIRAWRPERLVVGVPVHADGSPHAMTARARRFARQLGGRFALPVAEVDERHTSEIARAALAGRGRAARAERDALAAQIILQAWLDERAAA